MTREEFERDSRALVERFKEANERIRQATADANAIKGALEYIDAKIAELKKIEDAIERAPIVDLNTLGEPANGSDSDQHDPDSGTQAA
jgi:hypothetical protein